MSDESMGETCGGTHKRFISLSRVFHFFQTSRIVFLSFSFLLFFPQTLLYTLLSRLLSSLCDKRLVAARFNELAWQEREREEKERRKDEESCGNSASCVMRPIGQEV